MMSLRFINNILFKYGYELKKISTHKPKTNIIQSKQNSSKATFISNKKINPKFVNKALIARNIGFSREYVRLLLIGERSNEKALSKIHNEIRKQLRAA